MFVWAEERTMPIAERENGELVYLSGQFFEVLGCRKGKIQLKDIETGQKRWVDEGTMIQPGRID
jgi:hypothetical protein